MNLPRYVTYIEAAGCAHDAYLFDLCQCIGQD
jgi:hypothetical protein